jgi:hypothetical protein
MAPPCAGVKVLRNTLRVDELLARGGDALGGRSPGVGLAFLSGGLGLGRGGGPVAPQLALERAQRLSPDSVA